MKKILLGLIAFAAMVASADIINEKLFSRRAEVTFPGYTIEDTLENFPVLVRLVETEGGFSYEDASEDGSDIRFALADGTVLSSEVALWNPDGESQVWVSIPALASDTAIYMYWGGPNVFPNSQTDGSVWTKAGYFGVWHMDEAADATTAKDSAGGSLNGTHHNTTPGQDGKVGRSVRISSSTTKNQAETKSISTAAYSDIGGQFMFSLWAKYPNQDVGNDRLASHKTAWNATSGWEISGKQYDANHLDFRGSSGTSAGDGGNGAIAAMKNMNWSHLAFIFDNSSGSFYLNNSWKSNGSLDSASDNEVVLTLGNEISGSGVSFKGWMDEVRLYKGVPTRNWISTEYNSVDNTAFAAVGVRESLSTDDPVLGALTLVSADLHGASLDWQLNGAGSSATDVRLAYGVEAGVYTVTNTLAAALTAPASDTVALSGLLCGTTYYMLLIAENASVEVSLGPVTFTTAGAPAFSDVALAIADGTATASATLVARTDTATVSASCLFGKRFETPAQLENWTVTTSPAALSATQTDVSSGTFEAHFEATSTCSVCGKVFSIASETVLATVPGDYQWTGNAGDSRWSTPGNWSPEGVPTSSDTAIFGDGVEENLVVALPSGDEEALAAKVIRVTSATPLKLGTSDGPAMPAVPIEVAAGAGLVTVDTTFDLAADVTLTVAAESEIDLRSVAGTANLVVDGAGTVKLLLAGSRTAGQTEVKGGVLLISHDKQLGRNLVIGGAGKPAVARSNNAGVGTHPFGDGSNQTFVKDMGVFDLETDGVSGHWQKENVGPIFVEKGGTFLPGKRRIQFSTKSVADLTLTGALSGGAGGTFDFPDSSSLVVSNVADAAQVINSHLTVTTAVKFDVGDISGAPVDLTIAGGISYGWHPRDAFWKKGAGVLRLTGKSTYGGGGDLAQGQGTTQIQAGTLLVDNDPTVYGSGTGNSLVRVDGGTVLGGTGRIGGLTETVTHWGGNSGSGKNTRVTAKGTAEKQAVVWPGTLDAAGDHINGTLTVGIDEILDGEEEKRTLHHPVTFGDYSTLKASFGSSRDEFDALVVNGAVDISATGTQLELVANDAQAKVRGGTFTILSATDGITGEFASVVRQRPGWRVDKVVEIRVVEEVETEVVTALTVTIPDGLMVIVR